MLRGECLLWDPSPGGHPPAAQSAMHQGCLVMPGSFVSAAASCLPHLLLSMWVPQASEATWLVTYQSCHSIVAIGLDMKPVLWQMLVCFNNQNMMTSH